MILKKRAKKFNSGYTSIRLQQFYSSDPRLDHRLFYNRIDENQNLDVPLYIWSILKVILDLTCDKKSHKVLNIIIINYIREKNIKKAMLFL